MNILIDILCLVIDIVFWGIIIWIVLSYVVSFGRLTYDHPVRRFYDFLSRFIDPVLRPLRNAIPPVRIGGAALDLSPLVLIIGLQIARAVIC
jgi:YggT family protein